MKIHNFNEEDLRILASFAIDLETDHLFFRVFKTVDPKDNYWAIDCRFAVSADEIETWYDSFNINCGRDNVPETYQMSWNVKKGEVFDRRPICSPLIVVHQFEEMCKKEYLKQN